MSAPDLITEDLAQPEIPSVDLAGTTTAPSFGINVQHTSSQPRDTILSPLQKRWAVDLGGVASYPLIVGDWVFATVYGPHSNVRALNRLTGELVWGPVTIGDFSLAAYDGGQLFVIDLYGRLTAFVAATGTQLWSEELNHIFFFDAPPIAVGGLVYLNAEETGGFTYAIDERSGKVVWYANTFDGSDAAVAVADGVVYEAEGGQQLSAFDALTGALLWYHVRDTGGGAGSPSVYGDKIWLRDANLGGVVLDLPTRNTIETFRSPVLPALSGNGAYYLADNTLSAVDVDTSQLLWTFSGDGQLCTSPVLSGNRLFVGSASGNLYELDPDTGLQITVDSVGVAITCSSETSAMAMANGTLVIPAGNLLVAY